jgi:flagellar basal-body rod modification protein FlgD
MLTSTVAASNASNNLQASTATGTAKTTGEDQQDRFLKLLVAQLQNQDPTAPLDNAQMTSQIAQINTVTGVQTVNETLKGMADQIVALQVMQGSTMVGHNVLIEGSKLNVQDGKAAGAIELSTNAQSVKIEILSSGGQVIDTLNLGALEAGRRAFEWNAASYPGTSGPSYRVVATNGAQNVPTTNLVQDKVVSVGSENGAMLVQLQGGGAVAYGKIKALM